MNILIVDDHPLFLGGLRDVLGELDENIEISEANSVEAAFEYLDNGVTFEFVCLDLQLPGMNGIEFLRELRARRIPTPVLILSAVDNASIVNDALNAGANGYLSKAAPRPELLNGFRAMLRNGRYISSDLRASLDSFRAGLGRVNDRSVTLTRRQLQVLTLIAEGLSNAEIGKCLNVAESTIKGHVVTLFSIFDVENRLACINEARALQILP